MSYTAPDNRMNVGNASTGCVFLLLFVVQGIAFELNPISLWILQSYQKALGTLNLIVIFFPPKGSALKNRTRNYAPLWRLAFFQAQSKPDFSIPSLQHWVFLSISFFLFLSLHLSLFSLPPFLPCIFLFLPFITKKPDVSFVFQRKKKANKWTNTGNWPVSNRYLETPGREPRMLIKLFPRYGWQRKTVFSNLSCHVL